MAERSPAERSPLSEQGISLNAGLLTVVGGTQSNINDIFRPAIKAKRINNLHQFKSGVFSSSGNGWTRVRSTALNGGAAGLDFGIFTSSAGVDTLLMQVGDDVMSYDFNTNVATNVVGLTGLSTTALPCMKQFSPSASTAQGVTIYCNGVIEPRKITGAAASAALLFNSPGVWPGVFLGKTYSIPKFCVNFGNRMVYFGFSGATTFMDLLISNAGDAEVFTQSAPIVATDGCAFTFPLDLGAPTGVTSYKLNNENSTEILILGFKRGMAILQGTDTTNYRVIIASRKHGLLSNRCFVNINNEVYYLATDGIRTASSLQLNAGLTTETETMEIYDEFLKIDQDNAHKAHAVHHPDTQEIQFWVPYTTDNGQCKHALITNYNTPQNQNIPIWYFKNRTEVACSIEFNRKFYGIGYDGLFQQHYTGNFYDTGGAGQAYPTFEVTLSLIGVGNPSQTCSIRKLMFITDGGSQKFNPRASVFHIMADGHTEKAIMQPVEFELESEDTAGTVLGSWLLGISAFPADDPKLLDEFVPEGAGHYWEVSAFGNQDDHSIDFAALHYTISVGGQRQ